MGFAVDDQVKGGILNELSAFPGFQGANRYLCGNELDYKLTTTWDSIDNLVNFAEKDEGVVEKLRCVVFCIH